jgi:hypothetical protein
MACAALLGATPAGRAAGPDIDVEGVAAWQGRNVVQSPNDATATRFSLKSLTGSGPAWSARLQASGRIGERHEWRVLVAPLSVSGTGASAAPIRFEGATFAPGQVTADYRFDSWRATWRWRWIDRDGLVVKVGATAKIRDAGIRLRQGSTTARKVNTGFVPLLHGAFERRLGDGWALEGDVDALAGGPGYAVDAGLRVARELSPGWRVTGGVRWLDGGADNDEVYSFATFTSVTVGVAWRPR